MKVAFLIRSLEIGGAERQLVYLARGLKDSGTAVSIGVFYQGGELEQLLESSGVDIIYLQKNGRWDIAGFLLRTWSWIKRENPDVLHGYLPGANIVAVMMKPLFSNLHVVWGVRASNMLLENYDKLAKLSFKLSVYLSRFTDLVIVNSNSGYDHHLKSGYKEKNMVVVHNGIDINLFKSDPIAGERQRAIWGIDTKLPLVGIVGRLDPMKGHRTFLQTVAKVRARNNSIQFICVGYGSNKYLEELKGYANELGVSEQVRWEDGQTNIESVYNALDVLISTSAFGEGFSNTLAEAMACGVCCIATSVGDAETILSDYGVLVQTGDSTALADGVLKMLEYEESEKNHHRKSSVNHIKNNFSIEKLVTSTLAVLENRLK